MNRSVDHLVHDLRFGRRVPRRSPEDTTVALRRRPGSRPGGRRGDPLVALRSE